MKKIIVSLVLCLSATIAATAQNMENTSISVGQQAPELKLSSPYGKEYSLKEITKGRIVLLDFWASWCRPCRNANPRLVALFEELKDKKFKAAPKGFTIVSVSLDEKKEAWIKAIEQDKLAWEYHLSDLGGWGSEAARIYGVQFIPQAFLVSADGKILGKYMFAEEAKADILKYGNEPLKKSKKKKKK